MGGEQSLHRMLGNLPDGGGLTLGALLEAAGSRAHGVALLLLALPEALPLPVPSASAVLGVPLLIISAHLVLFGAGASLPRRLRARALPAWLLGLLRERVAPILGRAERLSRARWMPLARGDRLLGLVCTYLSVLLLLPLPFFNVPPALCLVLIAWGMVQRDGVAVLAGLAGTVAITGALAGLVELARITLR